jgi:hypothetical protein
MRDEKIFKDGEVVLKKGEKVKFSIFYWENGGLVEKMSKIIFLDVFDVVHVSEVGEHFGVKFVEGEFLVLETA